MDPTIAKVNKKENKYSEASKYIPFSCVGALKNKFHEINVFLK